ncbi:MAG: HAMP domain-containing sensor histidine kinase [Sulfuricurvum sp.]|nr:HAMP domain-containing sensor histidine kinase [Sulfuricurvum sp.]
MKFNWNRSLKIKIASLFSLLIAIAFSLNWMVATQTIRGEKIDDLEKTLQHLLYESHDEYIFEPLTLKSDLTFLYSIPHNQMILDNSEASHLRFLIARSPYHGQKNEISSYVKLSNTLYLNAISDDAKLQLSVNKYSQKLLIRYLFSLLAVLIISLFLLDYYMKPLSILAQKTRDWKSGDSFDFSLHRTGHEIEEVSNAFSSLIRRLEGYRSKEAELFKEAAHELKTPLALMRSRLDVYENSPTYEKEKFVIDLGRDIQRLTDELKNVLFLESSDFEDPVSLNINTAIQNIVHKVDILAKRKKLFIKLSEKSFLVTTPEKLLHKALMALIENAMTYATDHSQIDIEIDPLLRTIVIANETGNDKYLFSSKIGHKMLSRLTEELNFSYEITQHPSRYAITLKFL